jgi:hypothetical protein
LWTELIAVRNDQAPAEGSARSVQAGGEDANSVVL